MQATIKEFLQAINDVDEDKFTQFVVQNKSKKGNFFFKDVLKELSRDKIDELCEQLQRIIIKYSEFIFVYKTDMDFDSKQNQVSVEYIQILQGAIYFAQIILEENFKLSRDFLRVIVYLNDILLDIPATLEDLQNNVAHLCEKMFHLNYVYQDCYLPFNTLIYLLKRTLTTKTAKNDLNRIYALRSLISKIHTMGNMDKRKIVDLFKKIAVSNFYNSTVKGQKIITLILIHDPQHLRDIHIAIRKKIYSFSNEQAEVYGKAYYEAWALAVKTKNDVLREALEFSCILEFITLTIITKPRHAVDILRKLLLQFSIHKKENHVSKLLCTLFQPALYMHLKIPDALARTHATLLFLDVFPLENPDYDIVKSDQELNGQFLLIQDLLFDEYPIVRTVTVSSICISMSINWELFPEDIRRTYFKIITNELSCDSSSAEVRVAVAKGMRALLENPLTVPTLQNVLPKLKHLFHDISESVRIAFCQVLLRIKHICAIKYFDIVPLEELLARLEEDPFTAKLIVNLIYNSYFPKEVPIVTMILRNANIIKENPAASKVFYRYLPLFLELPIIVKFICKAMHVIHNFALKRIEMKENEYTRRSVSGPDSSDLYSVGLACGFDDPAIVSGFMDAFIVMWLAAMNSLKKPESKKLLKQLVGEISKSLSDLVFYYKDTQVFHSIAYLGSLLPTLSTPCLASLCFVAIQKVVNETDPEEYKDIVYCLCNQDQGQGILTLLKEWIETVFQNPKASPYAKRRKNSTGFTWNKIETPKHKVGLNVLLFILNDSYCQQKILSTEKDKLHSFLSMIHPLKKSIETYQLKKGSADEFEFMRDLFHSLLIIAGLLNDEKFEIDNAKFFEDIVLWMPEALYNLAWPDTCPSHDHKITRRQPKVSSPFQNIAIDICKNFCTVVGDLACAGYPCFKSGKYMKFTTKFFNTGGGAEMVLHVSKVIFKHITLGIHMLRIEKQDTVINLVPDCFSKVIKNLSDDNFVNKIPYSCVQELQMCLTHSLLTMYNCNEVKEMATDVMLCFIRNVLMSIKKAVTENWEVGMKEEEPFASMHIKAACPFLLSTLFIKQKVLVCFCHNLTKYISKCGKDPQVFVSLCIILQKLKEVKNISRNLLKEIHCFIHTLEKHFVGMHPLSPAVKSSLSIVESTHEGHSEICEEQTLIIQNLALKSIDMWRPESCGKTENEATKC